MANDRKPIISIDPYVPSTVPLLGNDNPALNNFLSNEFRRISYPLSMLADHWTPRYQIVLHGASSPTSLSSTVQTAADYSDMTISNKIGDQVVTIDLVAGQITFNTPAAHQLLVKIDCSMILDRISGSNNTTILMHLIIDGSSQIIASAFSSNQTSHLSMYGGFLGNINGNAVVSIGLSYVGAAVISHINSFFDLQILDIKIS